MKIFRMAILFLVLMTQAQCHYAQNNSKLFYLKKEPKLKTEKPPMIILLHGLGSNEKDLFGLADYLPDNFLIVSPRAPMTISEGSYKWFDLKFQNGKPVSDPEEAEKSRKVIIDFIDQLKKELQFNHNEVYLCGFSQGCIMSFSVALTAPEKIKGVIGLSGKILEEVKSMAVEKSRLEKLKILLVHGTEDQVLPLYNARESSEYLSSLGLKFDYKEFKMSHTINAETIQLINEWLKKNK
jgi:phospholipase/carboxylesterase